MANYAKNVSAQNDTPLHQSAKEGQVKNSCGAYVFQIDNWKRLDRFLILGCEKGSYYASEKSMAIKNYEVIKNLLKVDGKKVVDTIVQISSSGRAPKNAPSVFSLAVCSVFGNEETRAYANSKMPLVCRFSTDMFSWANAILTLKEGKKGKGFNRAIGRWYTGKSAQELAYQICKYPNRSIDGKSIAHKDLLRISRPAFTNAKHNLALKYATHGIASDKDLLAYTEDKTIRIGLNASEFAQLDDDKELRYIFGHELAKKAKTSKEVAKLVKEYRLTRESIPNQLFDKTVWEALLADMPMTAMIRNLGQMSSAGLFDTPLNKNEKIVCEKLRNQEVLKKARIHPMNVFSAMKTYSSGHGIRSTWSVNQAIVDAMQDAFYASFNYVEPSNKNIFIGVDVSGSMGCEINGCPLTSREAACVMAMVIARTEKYHFIYAFTSDSGSYYGGRTVMTEVKISAKDSLETVLKKLDRNDFGSTDCSLPMVFATKKAMDVDAFIVLTDNETNSGGHPFEALKEYRKKFNKNAKLIVAAFTATEFSIADPSDSGMFDIVGLDSSVPQLVSDFVKGSF
jgi:60 kDa SS-A/Ro ribonucleoprotein